MNNHLATRQWLACGRLTIADVACFPYVALAPEGGVALDAYPNVGRWLARIRALPGYVAMPGL
jgi:glutathione S-transferase